MEHGAWSRQKAKEKKLTTRTGRKFSITHNSSLVPSLMLYAKWLFSDLQWLLVAGYLILVSGNRFRLVQPATYAVHSGLGIINTCN